MEIGTAAALTRYTYQAALAPGGQGQSAAVLQALQGSYANLAGNALGGDALASLASGLQAVSGNGGSADFLALAGGADARAAASLFSAGSGSGLDAALGLNGTLALAAYAQRQEGLPSATARSAALAANAEPASASAVQEAIQAAQSALSATTLNLLA